jgi:hypothetical protein
VWYIAAICFCYRTVQVLLWYPRQRTRNRHLTSRWQTVHRMDRFYDQFHMVSFLRSILTDWQTDSCSRVVFSLPIRRSNKCCSSSPCDAFYAYLVHSSSPPVHMFSEMNQFHTLLCPVLILSSYLWCPETSGREAECHSQCSDCCRLANCESQHRFLEGAKRIKRPDVALTTHPILAPKLKKE